MKGLFCAAGYRRYEKRLCLLLPQRETGSIERKIWKEGLVCFGGEWHFDLMYLGQKWVIQMVAKELWYPFIPPSKGCGLVYTLYLLQTWIINGIAPACFHPQKWYKSRYQMFTYRWMRKVLWTIRYYWRSLSVVQNINAKVWYCLDHQVIRFCVSAQHHWCG